MAGSSGTYMWPSYLSKPSVLTVQGEFTGVLDLPHFTLWVLWCGPVMGKVQEKSRRRRGYDQGGRTAKKLVSVVVKQERKTNIIGNICVKQTK